MKKIVRLILALSISLAAVLSLASCDMLPEGVQDTLNGLLGGKCAHEEVEWVVDKEADCRFDGSQHSVCKKCGETVVSNYKIPRDPNVHVPNGEWQTDIEPTCLREGERTQKCSVCSKTAIRETIPKLDYHNWVNGQCTVCRTAQPASTGLVFESNGNGTCTVTGMGTCTDSSLVIPSQSPEGDTVTAISDMAFMDNKLIKYVIIPDTVTSAGINSFKGCGILMASVPAPIVFTVKCNTITDLVVTGTGKIPDGAMQAAQSLKSVKMNEGVTEVGDNAFGGTPMISITMPDSLVRICAGAFRDCMSLETLRIGKGVVEILENAFKNADFLDTVVIPASVVRIANNAFYQCPRISAATFEVTEGWKANGVPKDASEMADPVAAASALKSGAILVRN